MKKILPILLFTLTANVAAVAEINEQRKDEILHLLRHDCGSCHGMRLEGGLGPALKPERFEKWSVDQLAATIIHGRPGTPMPPWRPFFSDEEVHWLATQLKQGVK
ncbi:MAG: cytochrome c [Gammaproteobacteria bacterium]|nr:cytochrome c [Gammaproteobacteria bacterium]